MSRDLVIWCVYACARFGPVCFLYQRQYSVCPSFGMVCAARLAGETRQTQERGQVNCGRHASAVECESRVGILWKNQPPDGGRAEQHGVSLDERALSRCVSPLCSAGFCALRCVQLSHECGVVRCRIGWICVHVFVWRVSCADSNDIEKELRLGLLVLRFECLPVCHWFIRKTHDQQ